MKNPYLLIAAITVCVNFFSCNDDKNQEKAALDQVLAIHDKVMADDGILTDNKMKLDSLLKATPNTSKKDSIKAMIKSLDFADQKMEVWMQKFDPDQKGKSHTEVMTYISNQKKQVSAIDSQLKKAVQTSSAFLKTIKK